MSSSGNPQSIGLPTFFSYIDIRRCSVTLHLLASFSRPWTVKRKTDLFLLANYSSFLVKCLSQVCSVWESMPCMDVGPLSSGFFWFSHQHCPGLLSGSFLAHNIPFHLQDWAIKGASATHLQFGLLEHGKQSSYSTWRFLPWPWLKHGEGGELPTNRRLDTSDFLDFSFEMELCILWSCYLQHWRTFSRFISVKHFWKEACQLLRAPSPLLWCLV